MTPADKKLIGTAVSIWALALALMVVLWGPGCTIAPKLIQPPPTPTEAVVELPNGAKRLTDEQRAKYNWLIAHGWGGAAHHIIPPLKADDGVVADGPGFWIMDEHHAALFAKMNLIFNSSLKR